MPLTVLFAVLFQFESFLKVYFLLTLRRVAEHFGPNYHLNGWWFDIHPTDKGNGEGSMQSLTGSYPAGLDGVHDLNRQRSRPGPKAKRLSKRRLLRNDEGFDAFVEFTYNGRPHVFARPHSTIPHVGCALTLVCTQNSASKTRWQ